MDMYETTMNQEFTQKQALWWRSDQKTDVTSLWGNQPTSTQKFLRILDSCGFFPTNFFGRVFALSKQLPSCLPFLSNPCDSRTAVSLGRSNGVDIEFLQGAFSVEKCSVCPCIFQQMKSTLLPFCSFFWLTTFWRACAWHRFAIPRHSESSRNLNESPSETQAVHVHRGFLEKSFVPRVNSAASVADREYPNL